MRYKPKNVCIDNWAELSGFQESLPSGKKWIFRGLPKESYSLQTSLERALVRFGVTFSEAARLEKSLVHKFQRHAQQYAIDLPADNDLMTWLTLMQHYGSPTRLQDWTYSFFVALYFAVEKPEGRDRSAVWCLDGAWCADQYKAILKANDKTSLRRLDDDPFIETTETFRKVIDRSKPMLNVYPGNAFRLNERLIIQQGFFLVPCDISRSFEDNLDALLGHDRRYQEHFLKISIDGDVELRKEILTHLYTMNITRATLFPGLQGFAESLQTLIASPNALLSEHAKEWARGIFRRRHSRSPGRPT